MINKELAIYLHIPFCARKCHYCDFLSAPANRQVQEEYVDALCREIKVYQAEEMQKAARITKEKEGNEIFWQVTSIFFGGGTPSLLPAGEILRVIDVLKANFVIDPEAEISIECNPGTVTREKLAVYRQAGVNRISLGLQSVNNEELKKLGRIHTYEQFLESYYLARDEGFININIDLMSALPGQTLESYEHTVETVLKLRPEHISAYSLIIEEGTPFYNQYQSGKGLPSEEEERKMYGRTKELLAKQGYHRYEVSNYALSGWECRHNQCYWTGKDYLGFGIGASSYFQGVRYKNEDDFQYYLENSQKPSALWREMEILSKENQMEEFMFLGLRCIKGVSVKEFERRFQSSYESVYGTVTQTFIDMGMMEKYGDRIALTDHGIDMSNRILAEFLLSTD